MLVWPGHGEGVWHSGLVLTNPTNGDTLVDTGPLAAGKYLFAVAAAASVTWVYDVQHRNAANDANIDAQRRRPSAGNEDFLIPNRVVVALNERLRVVLVGSITGEVQVSLFSLEQP